MADLRYTDVFVPGGFPSHTYNPRRNLRLEEAVSEVRNNLCKLVTVTGHTKSGKTVLVRNVLPREEAIWIDGGTIGDENEFWTIIIDQLELFQSEETSESEGTSDEFSGSVKGEASAVFVKGGGGVSSSTGTNRSSSSSRSRKVTSRAMAVSGLRTAGRALVIDDFHYLPRELQGDLVRALKPLIFDGLPVVIIAIPHRRYDAVKVEREMTARILPVLIPSWSNDELKFIPANGFPLLHGAISSVISDKLAEESLVD